MRTLYFDCFSGISGDMTIGALLDLGVPKDYFINEVKKLNVSGYSLKIDKIKKNGIAVTDFDVLLKHDHDHNHEDSHGHHDHDDHDHDEHDHHHHHTSEEDHCHHACGDGNQDVHEHVHPHEHRNLYDIEKIIKDSTLSGAVKNMALDIFLKVAEAESAVHGLPIDEVHFHEVGAIDSIIDIVGVSILIDYLKPDRIYFSHLTEGTGTIKCQHGVMPVPVPATMKIFENYNVPYVVSDTKGEMVTPTGAAIAASLADEFLEMGVTLRAKKSGYGSGKKDFGKFNCLRVLMMDNESENYKDRVVLLETNIDDASGEMLAHAMEKLFDKGAKDVYFTPIIMKKNRPATMLSVLCDDESAERLKEVIFRETTAIGVREQKVARTVMKRESFQKQTSLGEAKFKRCEYNDIKKCYPEYESVKKLAKDNHISYGEAYESLLRELL